MFDFEGNGVVINLHSSMKEPEKFNKVMVFTIVCYTAMVCIFSSIAYWSYGPTLEDMVTLNLPHDNLTSMIQIFYCFGLVGSYPMQLMPVFEIYEKTKSYRRIPTLPQFTPFKRLLLRTLLVIVTAIGAMIVPKFGLFINLIGAFACTALAFILPVYMYNKIFSEEISERRRWLHYALVIFGCICGAISFVVSMMELIAAFSDSDESGEAALPTPVQQSENEAVT